MTAYHQSISSEGRVSNLYEGKTSPCQFFPLPYFLVLVENVLTHLTSYCGIFVDHERFTFHGRLEDGRHHANAIITRFL